MSFELAHIKNMLRINKHRLDEELEIQAQIQFDISDSLATANARQSALKEELERSDAELLLDLRKSDVKRTVAELQAEILVDGEHLKRLREFQTAHKNYELWDGLYDSWKQRGFALKSLADLSMSNYFSVDTTYENNRKKIAESRETGHAVVRHRRT